MTFPFREILTTQVKFLTFQKIDLDLKAHGSSYLVYIFAVTWLVGIGRYWDHPNAHFWQYAGMGSLAYIVILAALLYLIVLPLKPARWSYRLVLVFVGLCSLPAGLYAIPVERFLSMPAAQAANAWFLAIVAAWRVALYSRFLYAGAGLDWFSTIVATVLPVSGIVVALGILNLEHVVFQLMAGLRETTPSANDTAYGIIFLLGYLAFLALPVTLLCYIGVISMRRYKRRGAVQAVERTSKDKP